MKNKITVFILLLGIVMVGVGILRGEVQTVLSKAVNLCLECIGIG